MDWLNIIGWCGTLLALTFLGGYIRYRAMQERDEE